MVAAFPWLSPRRVITGTPGWIGLYALGSLALANPFFTERSAGASVDYWNTMYLHGMAIGMVAVGVLLGMLAFEIRNRQRLAADPRRSGRGDAVRDGRRHIRPHGVTHRGGDVDSGGRLLRP
jgi:hypothetical protein